MSAVRSLLGSVRITSGRVLLIDPCYAEPHSIEVPSGGLVVDLIPDGVYDVYETDDFMSVTMVVQPMRRNGGVADSRLFPNAVGVDSGQVFFIDPAQLEFYAAGEFTDYVGGGQKVEQQDEYGFDYNGACLATLGPDGGGELGVQQAVAARTKYGDGAYDVRVDYDVRGGVVAITVIFDEPLDSDEDEDDEWDEDDDE